MKSKLIPLLVDSGAQLGDKLIRLKGVAVEATGTEAGRGAQPALRHSFWHHHLSSYV